MDEPDNATLYALPTYSDGPRMNLDDKVCLCFRITRRKLVNYVRRELPKVPSQLSQCGGAGTGCGWCIPFLKQIFRAETAESVTVGELETLTAAEYAKKRGEYVRSGKGTPPPGAEPPAPESDPPPVE